MARKVATAPPALTPEEEQFVSLYMHDGDVFNAYGHAFIATVPGISLGAFRYRALQLIQDPRILSRIAELRAPVLSDGSYSLTRHLEDLERIKQLAITSGNLNVAARMTELIGKASGHYVERSQQTVDQTINQVSKIEIVFVDPPKR